MKKVTTIFLMLLGLQLSSQAQDVYTLEQCTNLALEQNLQIKSTQLNSDKYSARKGEATSSYLPQINAEGKYSYYFQVPTQVIPASAFGGPEGQYTAAQLGLKQSTSIGFDATQLIYSQQLINGLKMVSAGHNITMLQVQQTKEDVAYNIALVYFNLENVHVQKRFAEENLASVSKLRNTTQNLYQAGLAGKSDLDRLSVTVNNIQSGLDNLNTTEEQLYRYLKFLMNVDLGTPISIDTTGLTQTPTAKLLEANVNVDRTDVKLLKNQMHLIDMQRKNALSAYIPTLAAFGGLSYTGFNANFKPFENINNTMYQASYVGVSLSIPIFDGLKNKYVHDQYKLDYQVSQTNLELLEGNINVQVSEAAENYNLQYKQSLSLKDNLDLATGVYNDLQNQYQQGLIGIADLLTAENSKREAQTNYVAALVKLKSAELEYNKATGAILK